MPYFPLFIDLTNKNVLIVGGGHTALRKAEKLLPFGCNIFFISEKYNSETQEFIDLHDLDYAQRSVLEMDIDHMYALVIMATDDPDLNQRYSEICQKMNIPINCVDEPSHSSFIFPALYHHDDLVAGVTSGGKGPIISSYIRQFLETQLPEELGEINHKMGMIRPYIKSHYDISKRKETALIVFHWLMKNPELSEEEIISRLEGGAYNE